MSSITPVRVARVPVRVGRVAVVGTGSRGLMFVNGVAERPGASIVAFCEPNPVRAEYYNAHLESLKQPRAPVYLPEQFKEMLEKEKVDTVVITCVDALHDLYIIPALEAGGEYDIHLLRASFEANRPSSARRLRETDDD